MRVVIYALVLGLMTMVASAATVANTDMALVIELDGSMVLQNTTDGYVFLDGYEILSAAGNLNSTNWVSIEDAFAADPDAVTAVLGSGAGAFGEASTSDYSLGELNLASFAAFAPGASWDLGNLSDDPSISDLTFSWRSIFTPLGDQYEGPVTLSALPGDTDFDGDVDLIDFVTLKSNFESGPGNTWADGDFTGDGQVKLADFVLLKNHFTGGMSVPEPASMTLVLLGAAGMALKRRRK